MGVSQVQSSFQNDGNFSQLDLQNVETGGPILRIETFRCSQPKGAFGTTASGTDVQTLAGKDHLGPTSNTTFRHIFSTGPPNKVTGLLEIREGYDVDGSWSVVMRDIDGKSPSFGHAILSTVKPTSDKHVKVSYNLAPPPGNLSPKVITSPIQAPIIKQVTGLVDLLDISASSATPGIAFVLDPNGTNTAALSDLSNFAAEVQAAHPEWARNVQVFERMGDFRDKCIHSGINLIGPDPALASEYLLVRAYRGVLIMAGRVFDPSMSAGASCLNVDNPLSLDTKPGVYLPFLAAYSHNVGLYQLGIDKVHSDYGGIPMALQPGSRLENSTKPVADSMNANRVLALLAAIFYAPDALPGMRAAKPQIEAFDHSHDFLKLF
ncbi:hypothetical protein GALMADRAFT_280894 [Galerina marginata CBS 339.88]|uniref:Uncharacterized protein n=1 Tax=Galerina marginata (strain CBS 339.88) TaxID=685588 RepID=A0A067T269_GALM3|nr:hypothetical protein GALMADRAFT_280894 [Galerina marginata CBS 339.88]